MLQMVQRGQFAGIVREYQADRYTKYFTTWNQFAVNLYAQVTGKQSLRDIEVGLNLCQEYWYHWGVKGVVRSTMAYANSRRPWEIYEKVFYRVLERCQDFSPRCRFRFKNPLMALDSTRIEMCLSVFPWAKFSKTKGALKIHTQLDVRSEIPMFAVITNGKRNDNKAVAEESLPLSPDSIVTFDKAYSDFTWLYGLTKRRVWFVTRARENLNCEVIGQQSGPLGPGVIADKTIRLCVYNSRQAYPDALRLVTYYDREQGHTYRFLTNNFTLAVSTIARIYRARWEIEVFFRWIKQNLKIKTFLGTSMNAVLTQIWTALIYYLVLAYIRYQTSYHGSLTTLTRVLKESVGARRDIIDLLKLSLARVQRLRDPCEQLSLL